jgi:hypothetical protein
MGEGGLFLGQDYRISGLTGWGNGGKRGMGERGFFNDLLKP